VSGPRRRRAVFLDRDGVLNELVYDPVSGAYESPLRVEQVRLLAGAARAAVELARAGFLLACASNQPAAAKGRVSVERLLAVHATVVGLLERRGVSLASWRLCMHHPDGVVSELAGACACRKPEPGMLLDMGRAMGVDLEASWMIGDTDADIAAGRAAGCRTVLIENPDSAHKRGGEARPDLVAGDLLAGAARVLGESRIAAR
jgi:D-glycero-D-manno-heptose 1,7-bisphosphate phosphatase